LYAFMIDLFTHHLSGLPTIYHGLSGVEKYYNH
jgi:hypothetical protein